MTGENFVLGLFISLPVVLAFSIWGFARYARRRKVELRWPQVLVGNLLVLLLLVSLLLPAGECYVRFFVDTTESFASTKLSRRWYDRHWHENGAGFRDDIEYEDKIAPGKRRVTFLGDSFTVGQGVNRIESLFAKRLASAHPDWEVHMLAKPGWDTGNEYQELRTALARGYQCDQVVLVYCLNDISDLMKDWMDFALNLNSEWESRGWLRQNSYLADSLYYRWVLLRNPHLEDYFPAIAQAYRGPLWEVQKQRLGLFRDVVREHGGRLGVVIFPFINSLGPGYPFKEQHEALSRYFQELGVPCLDLAPILDRFPPNRLVVNRIDSHPNEFAHEKAAFALNKFLEDQLSATNQARLANAPRQASDSP